MDKNHQDVAAVIDLDNTLVDTAYRKSSLILEMYSEKKLCSLEKVRGDFHLEKILGPSDAALARNFFEKLETEEVINNHEAPLFPGALEGLRQLTREGIKVIVVTGRPSDLEKATNEELKRNGCIEYLHDVHLKPKGKSDKDFKSSVYKTLCATHNVVAVVGDRPEDILAASENDIPAVLFFSTVTAEELDTLQSQPSVGLAVSESWPEVTEAIFNYRTGAQQMRDLRASFIESYSRWLSDIDSKAKTVVTIASIVTTLAGGILIQRQQAQTLSSGDILILLSFLFGTASLILAIRAFTSRYTSGALSTRPINVKLAQVVAHLLDFPDHWKYVRGDARNRYFALRSQSARVKRRAHYRFFQKRYSTHDVDELLNLRLFELRAANYEKLYPERVASKFLITSIVFLAAWVIIRTVPAIDYSAIRLLLETS